METEPPRGALLVTPREAYMHYGIYAGHGRVVHYAGYARGFLRKAGPVEEVSIEEFSKGRGCWMKLPVQTEFDRTLIVARARSRIGEDRYRPLSHNCVHFCQWCLIGDAGTSGWRRLMEGPRTAAELLVIRWRQRTGIGDPRYAAVLPPRASSAGTVPA